MKTQNITRKGIKELFDNACENWQKQITNLVLFQEGKEIEVEESLITKAYSEANPEQKKLLNKYFTIKSNNIKDRIKSWRDVLKELNMEESDILPYSKPKNKKQVSQNALAKIQAISEVLNEGWNPTFNNSSEYKYYPYFERKSHGWVLGSFGYGCDDGSCGLGFGSVYKNSDLAIYAGNTFIDIYKEYLPE